MLHFSAARFASFAMHGARPWNTSRACTLALAATDIIVSLRGAPFCDIFRACAPVASHPCDVLCALLVLCFVCCAHTPALPMASEA
eukprot:6212500-Pleurochrysis_carterae.AAC.7